MTDDERHFAASFLLGKTHGAIAMLLNVSIDQMRPKLQELFDDLTNNIAKIYYSNPDASQP